ncbi:hypothetical protein ABZ863_18760 [Saccharomonospora sp. NPDC046836]|uniref:restriction endonuclease-related protein n=1 Tax=Saccharomonospora sp. NPDC046836 TaxID=3156921 RepID=UPI00340898E2
MNEHSPEQRQERVVAAAVRAAYAWSVREEFPKQAMEEICRMIGVITEARGPGLTPTEPITLVEALRRSLGELSLSGHAEEFARAQLLDGDLLTDDAYDLAAEHACSLAQDSERTEAWLPRWTRMRADKVSSDVFRELVEDGDQDMYVKSRRFLIEHPAGRKDVLLDERGKTDAQPVGDYLPLAAHQKYVDGERQLWWSCPRCKYPMVVESGLVRCQHARHDARFQLDTTTTTPKLLKIGAGGKHRAPAAQRAEGVVCVERAVWQSIVMPGVTELRIAAKLGKYSEVLLWPDLDAYDLHVVTGDYQYDVKEYRSADWLIARLRERGPDTGIAILIPDTHGDQVEALTQAGFEAVSERQAVKLARRAAEEAL